MKQTTLRERFLAAAAAKAFRPEDFMAKYGIGTHMGKAPTLLETVRGLQPHTPFQIFLGSTQSSRLTIKDADLAAAAQHVADNAIRLFIHSPYIINLSAAADTADAWHIKYLADLLRYGGALGARGVVVHTGKHTKESYETGVQRMRAALTAALPHATPECPILLETSAGQGTETLKGITEFLDFVESFHSPGLRVCVDTCHVFACGHCPLEYTKAAYNRGLLRLMHFNDSQDCCGACKDRHALIGTGKIGIEKLTAVAEFCVEHEIPMLYE